MSTIIYLVRHAETMEENGIRNTNETAQMINEREILSIEGEEAAKELSKNDELKNVEAIWSSCYTRAKQTAKYIASENNLPINLDERLSERKLGDLEELAIFMQDKNSRDPSQEQLLYPKYKTSDGESAEETKQRMTNFLTEILEKYVEKRVVIVSHGGSIKFLLLNWCKVTEDKKLEYEGRRMKVNSPCLLKLTFEKNMLVHLEQIQ